jgi:hypothetical protein
VRTSLRHAAVPAGYALVAFGYWGVGLLFQRGPAYIGGGADPQLFIW